MHYQGVIPKRTAGFRHCFEGRVQVGGHGPQVLVNRADFYEGGVVAGYPMVDILVRLVDGASHDVDSSEMAFKLAGSMAFKEAFRKGAPVLLEPMMRVEATTPEDYLGGARQPLVAARPD